MKVYISGTITGLPIDEVKAKFQHAECILEDIGMIPVNPLKNGLDSESPWRKHISRDIELLLECDGILMLTDWIESKGANIEYFVAKTVGLKILFESNIAREHEVVAKIQNAIHEATGMAFEDYSDRRRYRNRFFARVIFAHHCNLYNIDIMRYVHRDRTMIYHYLNTYETEMKYNRKFRNMAKSVDDLLNQKCE